MIVAYFRCLGVTDLRHSSVSDFQHFNVAVETPRMLLIFDTRLALILDALDIVDSV